MSVTTITHIRTLLHCHQHIYIPYIRCTKLPRVRTTPGPSNSQTSWSLNVYTITVWDAWPWNDQQMVADSSSNAGWLMLGSCRHSLDMTFQWAWLYLMSWVSVVGACPQPPLLWWPSRERGRWRSQREVALVSLPVTGSGVACHVLWWYNWHVTQQG